MPTLRPNDILVSQLNLTDYCSPHFISLTIFTNYIFFCFFLFFSFCLCSPIDYFLCKYLHHIIVERKQYFSFLNIQKLSSPLLLKLLNKLPCDTDSNDFYLLVFKLLSSQPPFYRKSIFLE